MEFSVQNLCGFLIRSKLMAPDGMRAMYQRWQMEAKDAVNHLGQFTRWLVANKYVTEYQAGLLAKGHADNFFLGEYLILERLGRGRMAGVYKAAHPLGQIVAIKVLPPSQTKNPQAFGRFQRESHLSLKLKHPNVFRSFQVGKSGDVHYLVMEYLEGETLEEVLQRRKRLPPGEAVRLVHQALTGLQHIHELGMVHRDLKPANLMLTPSPVEPDTTLQATMKVLDIGLARQMFDEDQNPPPENRLELTGEGVLLGTPDYLAPEQARDPRTIDVRADIYSLGCVLYHALTGQPPFPDRNILSQLVRHAKETPRPLKEFNAQIPDGLQQILNWMMAKSAAERYPTPERAAQALQMFLLADNVPAQSIDAAPQMRNYLTWLESNQSLEAGTATLPVSANSKPPASAAIAKASPAAAPASPLANPGRPIAKPPTSPQLPIAQPISVPPTPAAPMRVSPQTPRPPHRGEKKRQTREARAVALPAAVPIAAQPLEFDVELIAADAALGPAPSRTRRDWLIVGIGGGIVLLLLVAVTLLIVMLTRSE